MKRVILLLFGVMLTLPVHAADVTLTVTLTDADQQTLTQALDSYVKAGGIGVAANAVVLLQKLQAAAQKAQVQASQGEGK